MGLELELGNTCDYPYSAGYIAFGDGMNWIEGEAGLFWNKTNNFLGVNTVTPLYAIHVINGCITTDGTETHTFHWINAGDEPQKADAELPKLCAGKPDYWLGMPTAWLYIHVGDNQSGEKVLVIPAYVRHDPRE